MLTIKSILKHKLWLACLLSIVIIFVGLPIIVSQGQPPEVMPLGINVKNGDRIFYNFLDRLKSENAVLVLGTSETGKSMDGNNYWALLNRDEDLNRDFYSFGGAGRCTYVYFPLILDNPEAFKDLEIIVYLNPTYWRRGLNGFHSAYYSRYINPLFALSVKGETTLEIYNEFMAPAVSELTAIPFYLDRWVENYKSLFYSDLAISMDQSSITTLPTEPKVKISDLGAKICYDSIKTKINLTYNASNEYLEKNGSFPVIDTSTNFQYNMLSTFIQLTEEFDINCIFYLGPYNGVYGQAKKSDQITAHQTVVNNIKGILKSSGATYIDGSYQSSLTGTFTDIQHISEYGAYLTALDIKRYYEK